jgi:hypothetical protein
MRRRSALVALLCLAACRQGDGPLNPGGNGRVFVMSDPPGARLLVDSRDTGLRTPDTLRGLGGRHDITAQLDTLGATFGFTARIQLINPDSLLTISGPLVNRCSDILCYNRQNRPYAANRMRFRHNPVGVFFLSSTGLPGIVWPQSTSNGYGAGSMPAFAGILAGRDTVAMGIYDEGYLAGRPVPQINATPEQVDVWQVTWIVPPPASLQRPTVRGIEIEQQLVATSVNDDLALVRLVFRNITHEPLYAALDPTVPGGGLTYDQVWIGFMLDPDIGTSSDDALSYDRDLDMAFAYDARFDEADFQEGFNRGPGLVGLRMVQAPAGTRVIMNGWTSQGVNSADWFAGQVSERTGWQMLSGTRSYSPDHSDPRIGHLPLGPGDVRLSVSAGPLRLAPGDSAAVTVAIFIAEPTPGSFASGTLVDPGDPTDRTRVLYSVASTLLQKAATIRPLPASPAKH